MHFAQMNNSFFRGAIAYSLQPDEFDSRAPSSEHRIFIGSVYVCLSALFLPVYLAIITIFLTHRKFKGLSCYWIMSAMGICDCIIVVGQIGIGSRVISKAYLEIHRQDIIDSFWVPDIRLRMWSEKAFLGLLNAATVSAALMHPILAFNRLLIITEIIKMPSYVYFILLGMGASYIPFYVLMSIFEDCGFIFHDFALVPSFLPTELNSNVFPKVEGTLCIFAYATSIVMYLIIVVFLITTRLRIARVKTIKLTSYERTILIQSFVTFVCGGALTLFSQFSSQSNHSYKFLAFHNVLEILFYGALSPVIYLTSNSQLREVFKSPRKMIVKKSAFFVKITPTPACRNTKKIATNM